MLNFLRVLFLIVLIFSCNTANPPPTKPEPHIIIVPPQDAPVTPSVSVKDLDAVSFKTRIKVENHTEKQAMKVFKAQGVIQRIFESKSFKQAVLSRKYTSARKTPDQIYKSLINGAETLTPEIDNEMDLTIEMYQKNNKTVGYTTPKSLIVYTNSKFHDRYDVCRVASNLVHEWSHKLGYDHSSAKDSKSVPYSLNDIIENLCPNYL